ncbi:MAG: cytochrome c1 [Alphaproteobacteria bacterium]|nr:cytochrome c1 [Alphaproteobacteria bacterium]
MKKTLSMLAVAAVISAATPAFASEAEVPPHQKWPHQGVFGTYDKAALQRGFQVYKEVCAACHSMKLLSYRDLTQLGYTPEQVKTVAAEYQIPDGPNDEGEMFERPGRPADRFHSPFPNDKAARAANGGALPPDMSLLSKAREHGDDYIYSILTGYEEKPAGFDLMPGLNYNKYFAGHQIAMAKPLNEGQVTYTDGTANTLEQQARDVTQFLAWASEPHMEQRKGMGLKVMIFMLAFCGIMVAAKRKLWADIH